MSAQNLELGSFDNDRINKILILLKQFTYHH